MIQQALNAAGESRPTTGTSKSTEYFEALVEKKVKRSSSKLKWLIIIGTICLVIGGTIFAIWFYRNRSVQVVQQVNYGDAAGSSIASNNRFNVFMLSGTPLSNP